MVQLQSLVTYGNGVRPACLPNTYSGFPLENLNVNPVIVGWGSQGFNQPTVTHLREASVPIVDIPTCSANYTSDYDYGSEDIGNTQICANTGSHSSCHGDNGGPMLRLL